MKHLQIGLILSLVVTLNACKKDQKSTTENTSESSSPSLVQKFISVISGGSNNAIKKEKDGKYSFELQLKEGGVYKINSNTSNEQTVKMGVQNNSGKDAQSTSMDFVVKEKLKDGYKTEVVIKSMSEKQTAQGKEIALDTNAPMPKSKELQMPWRMQKAIINTPFEVELTNKGKVLKITGLEAIYKKVETEFKKEFKPQELEMIVANVKQSFNEEMLKKQFEKGINKFPNRSVAIGETWIEENNIPEQNVIQKNTYKLEKVENDEVIISSVGIMSQNNEKTDDKAGMKQSIAMSNSSQGKIIYDASTGWLKSSTTTESIKGKQSIVSLANNQTQSMEMTAKRVSTINK